MTAIRPVRCLQAATANGTPSATWDIDDGTGDPFIGAPYRWTVEITVQYQPHSCPSTLTPYSYNAMDVKVGDWLVYTNEAVSLKIISIEAGTTTDTYLKCEVEDVSRYNIFSDPNQSGSGIGGDASPGQINALVMQLAPDGLPIFSNINTNVSPYAIAQIEGRFKDRNMILSYVEVNQPGHTLTVGDLIFMDTDGTYKKAQANSATADRIVGHVNDVGTPSADWFAYQPIGKLINPTPMLPGNPGELIYLDPTTPGTYTSSKPTAWVKPVYIRLEVATKGILLDRNIDTASSLGYSSQVYHATNIAARDAISVANIGDQVFVDDTGQGEWGQFIKTPTGWVSLATQDSSVVDAQSVGVTIDFNSSSPIVIHRVSPGRKVTEVTVDVATAFDGTVTLSVGDEGDNGSSASHSRLLADSQIDLSSVGSYMNTPSYEYNGPLETEVKVYFTSVGSSQGQAKVTISYS